MTHRKSRNEFLLSIFLPDAGIVVNASSNFAPVTFFTVFKMCRHRVNAVLVIWENCVSQNFPKDTLMFE